MQNLDKRLGGVAALPAVLSCHVYSLPNHASIRRNPHCSRFRPGRM
jgi:hypothetical protein